MIRTLVLLMLAGFWIQPMMAAISEQQLSIQLKRLENESFEVREKATLVLEDSCAKMAENFLLLSEKMRHEGRMESCLRLIRIAKTICRRKIAILDDRYLELHGTLGIAFDRYYNHDDNDRYGYNREQAGVIVTVTALDTDADNKLMKYDVITHVNDKNVENLIYQDDDIEAIKVAAGKTYELTIHRPKNIGEVSKKGSFDENDEYDVIKVMVVAARKKPWKVDQKALAKLYKILWREFCLKVRAKIKTKAKTSSP